MPDRDKVAFAILVGNMKFFRGRYGDAIVDFLDAVKVAPNSKWALFGLNQSRAKKDNGSIKMGELAAVIKSISTSYGTRTEPRAQVLAKTTELICRYLKGDRSDAMDAYIGARAAFDRVDGQLSLYSQLQKRNISRQEYDQEMQTMIANMRGGKL